MSASTIWPIRGAVLLVLLVSGWVTGSALRRARSVDWPKTHKLRVLTTIFPLYDFARTVAGDDATVINLLPPGVDPHEFALSPRDVSLVAHADVIIANGAGLDEFVTEAIRKAGISGHRPVIASEGLASGATDPHLWVDPRYACQYVTKIAEATAAALEQRGERSEAERVGQRASMFAAELARLDAEYRAALAPLHGRGFVTFHSAFTNLAREYGLRVAGVWEEIPGREPAPREVGRILDEARSGHARAIFSEPSFSPRALEMIAHDAHLPIRELDPMETAEDFQHTHYIPVMRRNMETLVEALR